MFCFIVVFKDQNQTVTRNKFIILTDSSWRISQAPFLELCVTKLLVKGWRRKSWKEMKAGKRLLEKAGRGLWWRRGGERWKVSPPSDISCAREAGATRSAEVQVSERDDWLTRPSGASAALRPGWTFHPSFPPSPHHSSVTHPSLPSTATLFGLFTLSVYPQNPSPVILSSFPPSFPPPLTFFFTP